MPIKYYLAKLIKKARLVTLKNGFVHSTAKLEAGTSFINSEIGRHSFCGYDCFVVNAKIGSFCSIANNVKIGGGQHPIDWVSTSPVFYAGRDSVKMKYSEHAREAHLPVVIGHDVWIGDNAIIKQGLEIGTGAVVGMGSVVTRSVAPYSIVAGVPAREIRPRFDKSTALKLLESKWWDKDDAELRNLAKYIQNPASFLTEAGR